MLWLIVVPVLVIYGGVLSLLFPLYYERVRSGWRSREIPLASILQSGEAVHAKGVGNLAAVMDVMLHKVPDDPAAGKCVYLAFPLILDSRLQI